MEAVLRDLVPSLAARGVFGGGSFLSLTSDKGSDLGMQFGSQVSMVKVNMRLESGETESVPIVIKTQFDDEEINLIRDSGGMFSNEVNMYREILPYLNFNKKNAYPKLYYGFVSSEYDPQKDVVIVENINSSGFSLSPEKLYLNYNYISVAMRKIGELHAWSYVAKARDRSKFFEVASKVRRLCFVKPADFDFEFQTHESIKRGVNPLLSKGKEVDVLKKFIEVMKPVWDVQERLFDAEEPFGVVLHGDYCKNNVYYKYDSNGTPVDCMYFDFQLSKYGSPAVDLSFFLYMHTNAETREMYWDEFLETYWSSVRNNVPSDIDLPSFEKFLDHFSSRAVYGYIHCSYFAPHCLLENPLNFDDVNRLSVDEKTEFFSNIGGEMGEKCLVDIVSHLLEKKYIQRFLEYYNTRTM